MSGFCFVLLYFAIDNDFIKLLQSKAYFVHI